MIEPYKAKVLINLKKVRGQVELIEKMIATDKYCVDIAQQVNAAMGLLRKTNSYILESHLLSCATSKLTSKSKVTRQKFTDEIIRLTSVANR